MSVMFGNMSPEDVKAQVVLVVGDNPTVLELAAGQVAAEMVADGVDNKVAFDYVSLINVIAQAIINILGACKKTPEPGPVVQSANSPGVLQRWHVRQCVRKTLDDNEAFNRIGKQVVDGIFKAGSKKTEAEMSQLITYVKFAAL